MFTRLPVDQMRYAYQAQVIKITLCCIPEPITSKSNGVITLTPGLNATEGNLNDVGKWISVHHKELI